MKTTELEKSFESLFRTGPNEDFSDFPDSKLRTDDGYVFDVHRVILARANCYFHTLFRGLGKDKRDFLIPGIKGRILEMILQHIYNGTTRNIRVQTTRLTRSNIGELMIASDYLLADSLLLEIKQFAKHNISLKNCIPIYVSAVKINYKNHHKDILRGSYRYIQTHFDALVSEVDIRDIPFESMKQFVGDKNLCVRGERDIWFAIVKWTQGRKEFSHRLSHVPDFLLRLKWADVGESLAAEILCHDIVANNDFCKDLNEIRSKSEFENTLSAMREYYMKCSVAPRDFYSHRRPGRMHLLARYRKQESSLELFVTYDENLDVWRKVEETYCYISRPKYLFSIGHSAYIFNEYGSNKVFDIFEKRWRNINSPRFRYDCHFVNFQNMIYVVGGKCLFSDREEMDVEFYCSENGRWIPAMSMMPIKSYTTAAFQDKIYVVGKSTNDLMMMAQVYDADSDSWTMFSPPSIFRYDFALVAYHGKLYIVGGRNGPNRMKDVERFDFERHAWEAIDDLPYAYLTPKAIVLNDRLVIFDEHANNYPPVLWNETETSWKLLDKSFDRTELAFYLFCTVDDSETIAAFSRENRNPRTQFEKCPFNETQLFSIL